MPLSNLIKQFCALHDSNAICNVVRFQHNFSFDVPVIVGESSEWLFGLIYAQSLCKIHHYGAKSGVRCPCCL